MRNVWTRDELILALDLYFRLPFGRLNRTTPEVIELAYLIGRTNNSVALRLVNFAACDPVIIESGRTGMPGGVSICKPIWDEFLDRKEDLFLKHNKSRLNCFIVPLKTLLALPKQTLLAKTNKLLSSSE